MTPGESSREVSAAYCQRDPELYCEQFCGTRWWYKQAEIARALLKYKKVMVLASHSTGKTMMAGSLVNWFVDCYAPSLTLTTAPTQTQVVDLLWKEVRIQRGKRPGLQPKAPRLQFAPNHFAAGYTALDANAFQGRHEEYMLFIFDEAVGVDGPFWDGAYGMLTGDEHYWLCIMNPTDTATRAYEEYLGGDWHIINMSAFDHPNIALELDGKPPLIPAAVRLGWVQDRIRGWCTPLLSTDHKATDIEFPPGSNIWYRPGPLAESRLLGRWPSTTTTSVWSEAIWLATMIPQSIPDVKLEIGADIARFGDDYSSFLVRRGPCALHHETHNGWSTGQTAGRLKQLAKEYASEGEDPTTVAVKIDADGVGGGVSDQAGGFNFQDVNAGGKAFEEDDYPNRRSELWFSAAEIAEVGGMDLSRLSEESKSLLRRQVMAPKWKVNSQGKRVVEPKEDTKKRIGRSPDDADALNLAYSPGTGKWTDDASALQVFLNRYKPAPAKTV